MASGEKNLEGVAPPSRVFAYEWHVKELRDRECVRVARKGLAESHFCAFAQETKSWRDMPPPVFLSKSAQAIENKRLECEKERQERKRVCKPLKRKGRRRGQASQGSKSRGERVDEEGWATVMA